MLDVGPWHVVAVAVAAGAVWTWRWVRAHAGRGLAHVLEQPWYLWPLTRAAVGVYKRELHKDIYGYTFHGWDDDGRPRVRAGRYIHIRVRDGHPEVKIGLGAGFPQGDEDVTVDGKRINPKKKLVQQATGVLGLGALDYRFDFWLWRRHVKLWPKLVVPTSAIYHEDKDVREAWHTLRTRDEVVVAIGKGDQPVVHSFDSDAPHFLISASTMGGGKTTTLRNIAVQQWLEGAELLIIDPIKQHSHTGWAINPRTGDPYPRITYCDEIHKAAEAIVKASRLMDHRNTAVKAAKRAGRRPPTFPRLIIVIDDGNGVTAEFKRRSFDEARHHLSLLLWAGREVCINIAAAFQRASARAIFDGDVRECFGLRILAENSDKTGKMIADQVTDLPRVIPHKVQPGHCVLVYASLAIEAQRILISEDDCRRLIEAHLRALPAGTQPHGGQGGRQTDPERSISRTGHDQQHEEHGRRVGQPADEQLGASRDGVAHRALPPGLALDVGQVEQPASDDDDGQADTDGTSRHDSEPGDNQQDQSDGEWSGHGSDGSFDRPVVGPTPFDVPRRHELVQRGDTEIVEDQSQRVPGHPTTGGTMPSGHNDQPRKAVVLGSGHDPSIAPQWHQSSLDIPRAEDQPSFPSDHSQSQNHAGSAPKEFPALRTGDSSMQEMGGGFVVGGRDGGIEYVTLGEIEGEAWCDLSAETMARYARDAEHAFPKAAIPGLRGRPAKFSLRAVREFFEDQVDNGDYGLYVVRPPGSATVKIGYTGNLKGRLRKWNLGAHCVLLWIGCASKKAAEQLEDDKHREFEAYHDHLEWFWYRGRLVEWVEKELAERRQEVPA